MAFIPRIFRPGPEHFFLLGPRGTGKTLWSTHQYPKALRIDLLEPETLRQLSARPERLIELVEGNAAKPQVIIDEVQKLPALLEVVHLLIERKTGQQFILTGSSTPRAVDRTGRRKCSKTPGHHRRGSKASRSVGSRSLVDRTQDRSTVHFNRLQRPNPEAPWSQSAGRASSSKAPLSLSGG